jgi:hypothetical protein
VIPCGPVAERVAVKSVAMEVIYTVEPAKIVQATELMMCEPIVSKLIVAPVAGKVAVRPMKMATSEMSVVAPTMTHSA